MTWEKLGKELDPEDGILFHSLWWLGGNYIHRLFQHFSAKLARSLCLSTTKEGVSPVVDRGATPAPWRLDRAERCPTAELGVVETWGALV